MSKKKKKTCENICSLLNDEPFLTKPAHFTDLTTELSYLNMDCAVSEHRAVPIMQMVSEESVHLVRLINHQVYTQLLYDFLYQSAQNISIFFFLRWLLFWKCYAFFFDNKNFEVNTTKQKCSHAHNSAWTLQVLVTLFCLCLLFQTFLTSLYLCIFSFVSLHIFHCSHPLHCLQKGKFS